MNTQEKDKEYIASTYGRFPLTIVSGNGCRVTDEEGKEYIDLGTGIAVNVFGVGDEEWIRAVTEQLSKVQHTSNLFYSKPCADLAEELCKRTGLRKVFFSNSGAEANETAVKVARKYAAEKKGSEHNVVITLKNSFHGRTVTMLSATGQDTFHRDFLPLTEGFVYAEANNLDDVKRLVKENKVAAIMFETVQGEGGVLPLTQDFVKGLEEIGKREDILLIVDEVQTGNGRCGALYNYMNYSITPDIVTTAKGLGGGLPLGATMLGEKVKDVLHPGDHGSTFGGNPVATAGALSIIKRIDEKLLSEVREKSEYIFSAFKGAEGVKSVSGAGLMIGIETEKDASEVLSLAREKGVIAIKAKNKVRLLPPLNIPMDDLKKAVEVLLEVMK
ncbi:MAG: acetylornithine/succinylornithine family transaminase [Clostridia bacterium]|nr:acetylornithine/succinylornithine family transaminase [Clostridia bacterium]